MAFELEIRGAGVNCTIVVVEGRIHCLHMGLGAHLLVVKLLYTYRLES